MAAGTLAALSALWFALTLGAQIVTGSPAAPVAALMPGEAAGLGMTFLVFAAGAFVLMALVWAVAALTTLRRRGPA
jgi:Na+/melibiose symporter-like transporter